MREPLPRNNPLRRARGGHLEPELGRPGRLEESNLHGMEAFPERDLPLTRGARISRDGLAVDAQLGSIVLGEIESVERVGRGIQQPRESHTVVIRALVAAELDTGSGANP